MRAREFLVEYNRPQTISQSGEKLLIALSNDKGNLEGNLQAKRELWKNDKTGDAPAPPNLQNNLINELIDSIEGGDPTQNKEYTRWLVKVYALGGIKLEDIRSKVADWLGVYDQLKRKKKLSPESADIMRLSVQDLASIATNPENIKLLGEVKPKVNRGEYHEIFHNGQVRIIVPLDQTAACYYGNGTKWCTAGNSNNQFSNYSRSGKLYIFIPKNPEYDGEKYQFHFESASFMDEEDQPVEDWVEFLHTRFGDLMPFFMEQEPSIKKMLRLADDEVIKQGIEKIKQITMDYYINDKLSEWETEDFDNYYGEYLESEGYVNEDGEVDWEAVEKNHDTWLDFNDDARRWYDNIQDDLTPVPEQIREEAIHSEQYNEEIWDITDLEMAVAAYIENEGSADNRDDIVDFVKRLRVHIGDDGSLTVTYDNGKTKIKY